jgi:hypothetical protein
MYTYFKPLAISKHASQNHMHHVFVAILTAASWKLVLYAKVYCIANYCFISNFNTHHSLHLLKEWTGRNNSQYCKHSKLYIANKEALILEIHISYMYKNTSFSLLIMNTQINNFSTYMLSHVMPLSLTSQTENSFTVTTWIHIQATYRN